MSTSKKIKNRISIMLQYQKTTKTVRKSVVIYYSEMWYTNPGRDLNATTIRKYTPYARGKIKL